jgi:RNA polymerase sigma-70 factor (ECF subfamily)
MNDIARTPGMILAAAGLTVRVPSIPLSSPRPWTVVRQPLPLEQVFARYVDPVYRFLYRRLGNREDAEDLTAEVFLKASHQLDLARGEASIAAWLFTVARTVLTDHWRRYYRGGAPVPLDDARVTELPETVAGDERSGERARQVHDVLERLPDHYRQVLELRFLQGCSIRETALAMGLTEGNVKVLQHRALARAAQIGEGLP